MLISDSTLTPPSKPRITDTNAIAVMNAMMRTNRTELSELESTLPHRKPMKLRVPSTEFPDPKTSVKPEATCVAPKPRDVARPNSVANAAVQSIV